VAIVAMLEGQEARVPVLELCLIFQNYHTVHTVPLPGQALQMLPVLSPLSNFFIGTTNFLSLFLLRFALGDVDICLSFI